MQGARRPRPAVAAAEPAARQVRICMYDMYDTYQCYAYIRCVYIYIYICNIYIYITIGNYILIMMMVINITMNITITVAATLRAARQVRRSRCLEIAAPAEGPGGRAGDMTTTMFKQYY